MTNNKTILADYSESIMLIIEELDITYDDLKSNINVLIHILSNIKDYRKSGMVTYKLEDLIALTLILIMRGEFKSFSHASSYLQVYKEEYMKLGLIKGNNIPSHDTFRRLFMLLDPKELKNTLINKLNQFLIKILKIKETENSIELMSIDGKEFKGSGRSINTKKPQSNINVFNVYNASKDICLVSNPLVDKESEIKEAQLILNKFNLTNKIVTGDALHCQRKTCEIIKKRKGNYLFTVKDNQKALANEIKAKFEKDIDKVIEKTYNNCIYKILILDKNYIGEDFNGQKAYVYMLSNKRGKQSTKKQVERYFLTSLTDTSLICEVVDKRWKIENSLHKTKDEMFFEDEYTFTDSNAVKVMATFNNIAYSFFRVATMFLQEKSMQFTKIKFNKDPVEILEKITPLLTQKEFKEQILKNLKGRKPL